MLPNQSVAIATLLIMLAFTFLVIPVFFILSICLTQYKGFTRADLKETAKKSLSNGKYWLAFGVAAVGGLLGGNINGNSGSVSFNFGNFNTDTSSVDMSSGYYDPFAGIDPYIMTVFFVFLLIVVLFAAVFSIFVGNIISVGLARFFVKNVNSKPTFSELFFGFSSKHYGNVCKIMFLKNLYIFLWSLLFVIPGIIKAYEYYMIPFILGENPNIDRKEAFRLSKEMMHSNKWRTCVLEFSFLGWIFLGVLACGVGVLFVMPYMFATFAALYARLRFNLPEEDKINYLNSGIFNVETSDEVVEAIDYTEVSDESLEVDDTIEENTNDEAVSDESEVADETSAEAE